MNHNMSCNDCHYLPDTVCTNKKAKIETDTDGNLYCSGFRFSWKIIFRYEITKTMKSLKTKIINWLRRNK